jgi:hypothetical protein
LWFPDVIVFLKPASLANSFVSCFAAAGFADKPGSEEPHYHLHQEERVVVKQGKLGYFVGHQHHVQSAEPGDKEVVVKPGGLHTALGHCAQQTSSSWKTHDRLQ